MNRYLIRITAIAAALALAFSATALGNREVVRVGNLFFADNGGISPTKLPKRGSAPVTARIIGEIGTSDGSHPLALQSVHAEIDRTIEIDAVGLPTCTRARILSRSSADAKKACPDAIVGSGTAEVEVLFPEQKPFSSTGPVTLFNAGVHGGKTEVLLHAYVDVPAPTAIVATASVTKIDRGRYGLELQAQVPRIAGGAGSVTGFQLKIGRRFSYRGKKESFLSASCPTGSWATRGGVVFTDGTELNVTHIFRCTPEG